MRPNVECKEMDDIRNKHIDYSSKTREGWRVNSHCLIFSRSKNRWCDGKIEKICGKLSDEWLVVRYDNYRKIKKIQRNSSSIKPIPINHPLLYKNNPSLLDIGSSCYVCSETSRLWYLGKIIEIFTDSEGEWLKVKYNEQDNIKQEVITKTCDIQRYSPYIRCIPLPITWKQFESGITNKYNLCLQSEYPLIRIPEIQRAYDEQRENNKTHYVKYSDYIKHKIFKCETKQIDNKIAAIDTNKHYAVLELNQFPYWMEPSIEGHLVLFSTQPMVKHDIEDMIESQYPEMEYLWWMNTIANRSIPDIWHIQVVIKTLKLDNNNLLIYGFVKQLIYNKIDYNPSTKLINIIRMYFCKS